MRLWEAIFQDEFQDDFFQYNNCLTSLDLEMKFFGIGNKEAQ
jgi:hypothetical protein